MKFSHFLWRVVCVATVCVTVVSVGVLVYSSLQPRELTTSEKIDNSITSFAMFRDGNLPFEAESKLRNKLGHLAINEVGFDGPQLVHFEPGLASDTLVAWIVSPFFDIESFLVRFDGFSPVILPIMPNDVERNRIRSKCFVDFRCEIPVPMSMQGRQIELVEFNPVEKRGTGQSEGETER